MNCKCEKQKTIILATNENVCSNCPSHLHECEARELLKLPIHQRRSALESREKKRGDIIQLKQAMINIHNKRKQS